MIFDNKNRFIKKISSVHNLFIAFSIRVLIMLPWFESNKKNMFLSQVNTLHYLNTIYKSLFWKCFYVKALTNITNIRGTNNQYLSIYWWHDDIILACMYCCNAACCCSWRRSCLDNRWSKALSNVKQTRDTKYGYSYLSSFKTKSICYMIKTAKNLRLPFISFNC